MLFIVSEFVMRMKIKNQMQYPTFGISKIRFMSSVFVKEEKIINVRCFINDLDFFYCPGGKSVM